MSLSAMSDVNNHGLLSGSRSSPAVSKSAAYQRYWKEFKRRSLNKASILLVCYSVPAFCCLFVIKTTALSLTVPFQRQNCFEVVLEHDNSDYSKYVLRTIQTTVTYITFPLMGWMAEVCVGRTKIVTFSIYSMWVGMLVITLTYAISLSVCGLPFDLVKYIGTILGLVFLILGTAGFFANLLAYILEQMISEPSDKLRASVNWLTWSLFVGVTMHYFSLPAQKTLYGNRKSTLAVAIIITVLCTIILVIHQLCYECFVHIGTMNKNPSKLIWNVVSYAYKQPLSKRRSALSYWDKVMPSKFDLGKEKYGGPFSDEDVEDVKSFCRVFIVLCSFIGFYVTFSAINDDGLIYTTMFKDSTEFLNSHILFAFISGFFVIFVPVMELILIPCYPRLDYWMQSSLRGMGVSYVLFFISVLLMMILDIIGQSRADFKSGCYINHKEKPYQVSFLWYVGPVLLFNFGDMLNFMFSFLFIMSQAPLRMCGLLTGLFWLLRALGSNLAVFIKIPFDTEHISNHFYPACSFWILLIYCVICFICILCYIKLARAYQKRKKNIAFLGKEIVEEYYERLMNESNGDLSYPPLLTRSSDYFTYEAAIQNKSTTTGTIN